MASKCSAGVKKRTRNSVTLKTKLKMIELSEQGLSMSEIGRTLGLPRQTVSTIVHGKEKVLKEIESATPVNTRVIRKRDSLIADMEKLLLVWIEEQTRQDVPLSRSDIQATALSLFNAMKAEKGEAAADKFKASRGWFARFKERSHFHIKAQDEDASIMCTDTDAESYCEFSKIIEEGGYSKHQIFNVHETILFWKKIPSLTPVVKEENLLPEIRAEKDRLTLLLGANAAGDFKLKPMVIYHSDNPKALKNYAKASLPVYYKSNSRAWMTGDLFSNWFTDYFKPMVEAYCKEKNIPFKVLLLADNAPAHPRAIIGLYEEINVIFLPSSAPSMLQPMDEGVITAFKSYYIRRTFAKAINSLDSDTVAGNRHIKLAKFWKEFTILDSIKTIRDAWEEVKETTLKSVWKKLIPTLVNDFEDFENPVEDVTTSIVEMANELELEISPEDVAKLLLSNGDILKDTDLIEEQRCMFHEESYLDDGPSVPREMTTKELEEAIKYIEMGMAAFERIDPNFERSSKVNANLISSITCYKEIVAERRRRSMRQGTLVPYFRKVRSEPSTAAANLECFSTSALKETSGKPSSKRIKLDESDDDTVLTPLSFQQ